MGVTAPPCPVSQRPVLQRASVMVTDLVLMWAAYAWARWVTDKARRETAEGGFDGLRFVLWAGLGEVGDKEVRSQPVAQRHWTAASFCVLPWACSKAAMHRMPAASRPPSHPHWHKDARVRSAGGRLLHPFQRLYRQVQCAHR